MFSKIKRALFSSKDREGFVFKDDEAEFEEIEESVSDFSMCDVPGIMLRGRYGTSSDIKPS